MGNVLVVEDETHIRRLIKIVLERSGHSVSEADSGEKALEFIAGGLKPDLILLDIMMPGMDGLQVLQKLKQNPKTSNFTIIMLTAIAQENIVVQGIKLGAKDYIRKPFHPKNLMLRLEKYLPG